MRMLLAGMLAGVALVLGGGPTAASCTGPRDVAMQLAEGHPAFVGTVGQLRNSDRWATFQVTDVWYPGELPRFVEVRGSRHEDSVGIFTTVSSADRSFERGLTYLVFPTVEGDLFFDDACSSTQEWSSELEALRPPIAHPPVAGPAGTGAPWLLVAGGLATAVVIGAGAGLIWRRRSSER